MGLENDEERNSENLILAYSKLFRKGEILCDCVEEFLLLK